MFDEIQSENDKLKHNENGLNRKGNDMIRIVLFNAHFVSQFFSPS